MASTTTTTITDEFQTKTHSQDFIPSFIRKTYEILEEARFPQYIDWNPDGTAIVIKKPSEFSQKVLPAYFKHNNFTSFVRQLNMYNFHKRRSQGLDHIYVHELFRRGMKHLLKEIKRKTHGHVPEKPQKSPEVLETPNTEPEDLSSLIKENQFIKRLYSDAMNRLALLERQAKELAVQNQSLWSQVNRKNAQGTNYKLLAARLESQTELTQEQLPMTLGKITLNLSNAQKTAGYAQTGRQVFIKGPMTPDNGSDSTIGDESSGESTIFDSGVKLQRTTAVPVSQMREMGQGLQIRSDLSIVRQEISMGQIFEEWNSEFQSEEMFCFADQKPACIDIQAVFQDKVILGKRSFEPETQVKEEMEPAMKRHELCVFGKKGVTSTGLEDKEMFETVYYGNPCVGNEMYDTNIGIDLMDFN